MKILIRNILIGFIFLLGSGVFLACKKKTEVEKKPKIEVLGFFPNSGIAGTLLTIKGKGFQGKLTDFKVEFSGKEAEILSVQSDQLLVRAPATSVTGEIKLQYGEQNIVVGTYTYQKLSVHGISPNRGPFGSRIAIRGKAFSSLKEPAKVFFNGKEAIVGTASDTLLIAEVPHGAKSGEIEIQVDGMKGKGEKFTIQDIHQIKPVFGGPGTEVLITGEGFELNPKDNKVDFNGKEAEVLEAKENMLRVIVPKDVETGQVAVQIGHHRLAGPEFERNPFPEIQEVNPLSGPIGIRMTIYGDYFSPRLEENKVFINKMQVQIISASEKKLELNYPGGTGTGLVEVWVNGQQTEGPQFRDQHLGISAFSPDNGIGGTEIVLKGTGFHPDPLKNKLSINGRIIQVLQASENEIKAKLPNDIRTGKLLLEVEGVQAFSSKDFQHAGVMTIASGIQAQSIVADSKGNIYALIANKHHIVKINAGTNQTEIYAGSATGAFGNRNGNRTDALFHIVPFSNLLIDDQDNLYVSEQRNGSVRKITAAGQVSSVRGRIGPVGRIAINASGEVYGIMGADMMFKLTRTEQMEFVRAVDRPNFPFRDRNYVLDRNREAIYFPQGRGIATGIGLNPLTSPSTQYWVGSIRRGHFDGVAVEAQFQDIIDIQTDRSGNVWVADSHYLKRVEIATRTVKTIINNAPGNKDGSFRDAQINIIHCLAIDPEGIITIAQKDGNIRKVFFR